MTRLRCALAALVVVGALGGCSDDDPEPKVDDPTPSVSSGPTESESVSTSPTASPAMSAEDTVRAWVATRNHALATGETEDLRAQTDPDCVSCVSLITSIEEVYAAGGSYDTEGWTVTSAKVREPEAKRVVVDAAIVIEGGTTINEAGAEPVSYAPENHIMVFKLRVVDGDWLMDFVGFVS